MKAPLTEREEERLEALRDYRILDTPDEREYDDLVALAAQICDVPIALISLVDSNRQWFKAKVCPPTMKLAGRRQARWPVG
jgi:hypothetical protein